MMQALDKDLRGALEKTVKAARTVAETAAHAAVDQLGVGHDKPEAFLSDAEKALRNRLRTHGKQLGDARDSKSTNPTYGRQEVQHLVQEVAYQHWHRMLFARFLADNNLLIYDGVAVTIEECDELAPDEGAKSGWELAGKLAARMLPRIFRPDSPVYELGLPQEHQHKLEMLVANLPQAIFLAADSLGWVYQFWQANNKDQINKSGVKIGADELPSVTQLFTEDYMVDFLLDNTLGAWHAGKVLAANPGLAVSARREEELRQAVALPGCPWSYLRFIQGADGQWTPAAGTFDGWPKSASALKTLDPCMGSGHFVVAMFERLVALRLAEEKLDKSAAVAAVIHDNLFGLEIDPRCTQIAAFNLALAAWRSVGHCGLPAMNLACSGLAPNTREADWLAIAGDDVKLKTGMARLYRLFKDAPVLGSLINPRAGEGDLLAAAFHELQPLLEKALARETKDDTSHEMAVTARGLAKAAEILAGQFTLVTTNVPYLGRGKQDEALAEYCERAHPGAKADLATCFVERCVDFCDLGGSASLVTPQNWLFLSSYQVFRTNLLRSETWIIVGRLGPNGFSSVGGEVVQAALPIIVRTSPSRPLRCLGLDAASAPGERAIPPVEKATLLRGECAADHLPGRDGVLREIDIDAIVTSPGAAFSFAQASDSSFLSKSARSFVGLQTGDSPRWILRFWEQPNLDRSEWWPFQLAPEKTRPVDGCVATVRWGRSSELAASSGARLQGLEAWGERGVLIQRMSSLKATLYHGQPFDTNTAAIVPFDKELQVAALFAFCSSPSYAVTVRDRAPGLSITNQALVNVPFPKSASHKVASTESFTLDPTQWLFSGNPVGADQPLHVAVARLLGYQWPRQTGTGFPDCPALGSDGLEGHADKDGIVCIPAVGRELSANDRLLNLLADAYDADWGNDVLAQLLTAADHSGKPLEAWLRDRFFVQHCKLFHKRPFIWHVWDGLRDGFAALVNYHRLEYKNLEALIYNYLGDWISRQKRDTESGVDGAQEKLTAAEALKKRLELVLTGESPYDIFVRWKPIEEQPIGWKPDLNDGVRLNIRPFLSVPAVGTRGAGVLRDRPNVKWDKDRGSDEPSAPWFELGLKYGGKEGDRINDHHLSLAEKRAARAKHGKA